MATENVKYAYVCPGTITAVAAKISYINIITENNKMNRNFLVIKNIFLYKCWLLQYSPINFFFLSQLLKAYCQQIMLVL